MGQCLCCKVANQSHCQTAHQACLFQLGMCFCCDLTKNMSNDGCVNYSGQCICCCCENKANDICLIPEICCKDDCQCFCTDIRCSIPCDDDVPFQVGLCGVYCIDNSNKPQGAVIVQPQQAMLIQQQPQQMVMMQQQPVIVQQQPQMVMMQPQPQQVVMMQAIEMER